MEKLIGIHELVEVIVAVLDARDPYTFAHSWRVSSVSEAIAERLGLEAKWIERIHIAAHLHDIGKVGVPDYILNKTGSLSMVEYEIMKSHSIIGYNIVSRLPLLEEISLYVRSHHERFDGSGYPDGISGKDIPLGARVIAVADTFDALTTTRTYREAVSIDDAFEEIERCSGSQFCPEVVSAFCSLKNEIPEILGNVDRDLSDPAFLGNEDLMDFRTKLV